MVVMAKLTDASSWKATFELLSASKDARPHDGLKLHLTDPRSVQLLCHYLRSPPVSTPESRSSFATLTSAINITPTNRETYNIEEIKSDALWLSQETSIDEVSALRLVVLEWQSRPASQLLSGFSADADSTLSDGSSFLATFRASKATSGRTCQRENETALEHFTSNPGRHLRILHLYLSERQYLPKVCQQLVCASLQGPPPEERYSGEQHARKPESSTTWLQDVGLQIWRSWTGGNHSGDCGPWIAQAISSIQATLEVLGTRSPFMKEEEPLVDLEAAWSKTLILEAYHVMEIILTLTMLSQKTVPSAKVVIKWFQFVGAYGFFEQLEMVCSTVPRARADLFAAVSAGQRRVQISIPVTCQLDLSGHTEAASRVDRHRGNVRRS